MYKYFMYTKNNYTYMCKSFVFIIFFEKIDEIIRLLFLSMFHSSVSPLSLISIIKSIINFRNAL